MAPEWAFTRLQPYLVIPQGRICVAERLFRMSATEPVVIPTSAERSALGMDATSASNEVARDGLSVFRGNTYDAKAGPPL
jgi:hypothetical protein